MMNDFDYSIEVVVSPDDAVRIKRIERTVVSALVRLLGIAKVANESLVWDQLLSSGKVIVHTEYNRYERKFQIIDNVIYLEVGGT